VRDTSWLIRLKHRPSTNQMQFPEKVTTKWTNIERAFFTKIPEKGGHENWRRAVGVELANPEFRVRVTPMDTHAEQTAQRPPPASSRIQRLRSEMVCNSDDRRVMQFHSCRQALLQLSRDRRFPPRPIKAIYPVVSDKLRSRRSWNPAIDTHYDKSVIKRGIHSVSITSRVVLHRSFCAAKYIGV